MPENDKIKHLKQLAASRTLLYVEDNVNLQEQGKALFSKFFKEVYVAADGLEGLERFKAHRPDLIVSDVKMPKMDGFEMTRRIHRIAPEIKVIATSGHSDSETLLDAVNSGVYRFIVKPLSVAKLSMMLIEALEAIEAEAEERLFSFYVENIFNFQNSLIVLYKGNRPVIVNERFLDFFQAESLEAFVSRYGNLGKHFLEHKNFLYNHDLIVWFNEARANIGSLFHVKMYDTRTQVHHFLFKMTAIKTKPNHFIVSMDDITELGLLKLFDEKASEDDQRFHDKRNFVKLLEALKRNNAEIRLHNFYKGLKITNAGVVITADDELIEVRSNFLQQKAVLNEKKTVLTSEAFPADILCSTIKKVDFDTQSIIVDGLRFLGSSPAQREHMQLEPEENHKISLFYQEHRFATDVRIMDISLKSVQISVSVLPAGFKVEDKVHLDMVFELKHKPLIVNCAATVFAIKEVGREFHVILSISLSAMAQKSLTEYLVQRQMNLIREFKGL
jgi:CheY-like chemotaxis protein